MKKQDKTNRRFINTLGGKIAMYALGAGALFAAGLGVYNACQNAALNNVFRSQSPLVNKSECKRISAIGTWEYVNDPDPSIATAMGGNMVVYFRQNCKTSKGLFRGLRYSNSNDTDSYIIFEKSLKDGSARNRMVINKKANGDIDMLYDGYFPISLKGEEIDKLIDFYSIGDKFDDLEGRLILRDLNVRIRPGGKAAGAFKSLGETIWDFHIDMAQFNSASELTSKIDSIIKRGYNN